MSRAPRPHGVVPVATIASHSSTASSAGHISSTPCSPVYPVRQIITSTPKTSPIACVNAGPSARPSEDSAVGPCTARSAYSSEASRTSRAGDLALLEPRVRGFTVSGVHDEQRVERSQPIRDQVVDDPAAVVRQQRVLRLAVGEPREVVREQALEQLGLPRALDVELPHVRDVEDAAVAAHGKVLGDHALVLHGHLPAGEGNHACTERDMAVVQGRPFETGNAHGATLASSPDEGSPQTLPHRGGRS